MADQPTSRLAEISGQLDDTARRLRAESLESQEAAQLAGECAELASQAVAELERLANTTAPQEAAPGQEELL